MDGGNFFLSILIHLIIHGKNTAQTNCNNIYVTKRKAIFVKNTSPAGVHSPASVYESFVSQLTFQETLALPLV